MEIFELQGEMVVAPMLMYQVLGGVEAVATIAASFSGGWRP